ncbi:MAG: GNAT family N-acetyltransferase [Candidatus Thorarchaeota archaeon]
MTFVHRDCALIPEPYSPTFHKSEDILRTFTGLPDPMMNSIICTRIQKQNLENQVNENVEFFENRGVPHMWWVGPNSAPKLFGELLIKKGLVKSEWDTPTMGVDLRTLDDSKLQEISDKSGVLLNPIETETDLVLLRGLLPNLFPEFSTLFFDALDSIFRIKLREGEGAELVNFVAKIDGVPVGASTIVLAAGVAGLYNVGTLKEHRGKGVGSAVSLKALLYGRRRGYETGILQSTAEGYNVYTRLGFKEYFKWQTYFGSSVVE